MQRNLLFLFALTVAQFAVPKTKTRDSQGTVTPAAPPTVLIRTSPQIAETRVASPPRLLDDRDAK